MTLRYDKLNRVPYGTHEPGWVAAARAAYWRARDWREDLERRLCRTDAGTAFLYRVKAIGRRS